MGAKGCRPHGTLVQCCVLSALPWDSHPGCLPEQPFARKVSAALTHLTTLPTPSGPNPLPISCCPAAALHPEGGGGLRPRVCRPLAGRCAQRHQHLQLPGGESGGMCFGRCHFGSELPRHGKVLLLSHCYRCHALLPMLIVGLALHQAAAPLWQGSRQLEMDPSASIAGCAGDELRWRLHQRRGPARVGCEFQGTCRPV